MVAFLKDPSGPPLWEENPEAKDVVHIETEKVRSTLSNLVSFSSNRMTLALHSHLTAARTDQRRVSEAGSCAHILHYLPF